MAKQVNVNQSTNEEKVYPIDFSPSLLTGVTVTGATLEYSGDNPGDNPAVYSASVTTPIVYVSVSNLVVGHHRLSVVAQTSNNNLSPEVMLLIDTKW